MKLYDLRCEYAARPVIDNLAPRFSWKIQSERQSVMQTSYRIVVTDGKETVWDSALVESAQSQHVRYAGMPLESRREYSWTLTVTAKSEDVAEESASASGTFEMGLLKESDWKAKWIGAEQELQAQMPAVYLRRRFTLSGKVKKARLYQSAHGLYECFVNGTPDSDELFRPGLTSYYFRIQYQTSDVTALLHKGENVWALRLGEGWWRGSTGGSVKHNFGVELAYLGQLEIEYEDGRREIIASDESFRTAEGGLVKNDMLGGETFNARLEPEGWLQPGFDDSAWKTAESVTEHTDGKRIASSVVPVRAKERFDCTVFTDTAGKTVLDFGQNLTGYVQMKLRNTKPRQVVHLVHGEALKDGAFSVENVCRTSNPAIGAEGFQEITYICKGAEIEEYTPHFAVFGFRYVLLEGYKEAIRPGDFTAVAIYSDMNETAGFSCSNPLIDRLFQNCLWSMKGNFLDVPTDCPTRERNAWTGDAQIFVRTAAFLMDSYAFFEKWMQDQELEQFASGKLGLTFPSTSSIHDSAEFLKYKATNPMMAQAGPEGDGNFSEDSAGWGDSAVHIPYVLYQLFGDQTILENQYDCAKRWTEHLLACAREENPLYRDQYPPEDGQYILDTRFHFGEWNEPIKQNITDVGAFLMGKLKSGDRVVATAYMMRSCRELSEMAATLGKRSDAEKYAALAETIRRVYVKYLIGADGVIQPGHQAPYVRALSFGIAEGEQREKVKAQLMKELEANHYHLNTGFLSTPFLLDTLVDIGRPDLAYRLLEDTDCPGWLYSVRRGMTTIPEAWDSVDSFLNSQNHYSYGAVASFLLERVAGIQPLDGFQHIRICPLPGGSLTHAEASVESPYGRIASSWEKTDSGLRVSVEIPANVTAELVLPDGQQKTLGSGSYCFVCK